MDTLHTIMKNRTAIKKKLKSRTQKTKEGCWLWVGARQGRYGHFSFRVAKHTYLMLNVHVIAWIIANKKLPGNLHVLHSCDEPRCIRPDHLRTGTHQENMTEKMAKNRHPKGSEFEHAKLDEGAVRAILDERKNGVPQRTLAELYGVTVQAISAIDRGLTWKHVPRPK